MGLALSRKQNEVIYIGSDIKVTVSKLSSKRVLIHIQAPDEIKILRGEVRDADLKTRDIRLLR